MKNNVTEERGECTTMRDEYDPTYCFSLIVSYYSLHSQQETGHYALLFNDIKQIF